MAPTITRPPQSKTVASGATVILSVTPTGTPPFLYQWRLEGRDLAGATNAILVLTNVQPVNSGNYQVVVSNPANSVTSPAASLTLSAPPVITTQPQSTNLVMEATVALAVGATGTPPLRFQWRLEGDDIADATNSSLLLPNAQTTMTGEYTVIVSNSLGSVESEPALVNIGAPVTIVASP